MLSIYYVAVILNLESVSQLVHLVLLMIGLYIFSIFSWFRLCFSKNLSIYSRLSIKLAYHFSSVAQLCPTLCNPMNRSTPGLPVHHQLPEFTQIHVHQVSDAIQPSHPLSSPSSLAPNPSQHQSLFQ